MALTDAEKEKLQRAITDAKAVLNNAEQYVIQGDNPIVLGKKATAHTITHLRRIIRVLEEFR